MAVSFNELYNARVNTIGGGRFEPSVAKMKREEAYSTALQDFERLNNPPGGVGGRVSSPTTLREVSRKAGPMPSIGSVGMSKGIPLTSATPGKSDDIGVPTYDMGKVEGLAQRFAAPGLRKLRSGLQDVQQGVYENPNVKRMTLRDALAGYGQGLESVMGGALQQGVAAYGQEYNPLVQATMQQRSIKSSEDTQSKSIASNEKMAQYHNEFQAWLNG